MKWLKVLKNRLILALIPILLLWAYYAYLAYGPVVQSVFAGSITLSGAILLEAAILWPFAQRWSRRRIVVIVAFIGLIIWGLWTLQFLVAPGPWDASPIVIDEDTGSIWFQPTLSNLVSDLVALPHVALGLIYQSTVAGVVRSVLAILGIIAPLVVLPAVELSIVANVIHRTIPPYLDGSLQLTSRQRVLLVVLGVFLPPGLLWIAMLLYLLDYYDYHYLYFDNIYSITMVSCLSGISLLGYLFRPFSSKWTEKRSIIITSFALLLLSIVSLLPLPLSLLDNLPLWVLPERSSGASYPYSYIGPSVLLLLPTLLGGIAWSIALGAIQAFSPWSSKTTQRMILGSLVVLTIISGYSTNFYTYVQGGVSRYDGRVWNTFTPETEEGFAGRIVSAMLEDSHGNIWIGTESGLNRYDGLKWETLTTEDGLIANQVYTILEDRQRNIWIGTPAGVGRYDGQEWQVFTDQDGAPLESVGAMLEDHQGNIWVVNYAGPSRYDGEQWEHFSLETYCLGLIYEDRQGNIWFGTPEWVACGSGLTRYDGANFQTITKEDGLAADDVYSILEDSYGDLWFAAFTPGGLREDEEDVGGITRYDGVSWETVAEEGSPSNIPITFIFEDHNGNLWFGGDSWLSLGGLIRYDRKAWQKFTVEDGLASNAISAVLEDAEGNLWIGTSNGLNRYSLAANEWETFTSLNSGLVVDSVENLLLDQKDNLWVGAYTFEQVPRALWLAITVAALVFLGTPALLYRRFIQLPGTRAERLGRRLERAPEELYPTYYHMLAFDPDAVAILQHQGDSATFKWAPVPAALGALAEETADPVAALKRLLAALPVGPDQPDQAKLQTLYQFMLDAAQARTPVAIADLGITVRPDPVQAGTIIHTHAGLISPVPEFLSPKLSEALAHVETLVDTLRNYAAVDSMSDKLSYLASSLSSVEALQKVANGLPVPDGPILTAIATRWRTVINDELDAISGRAELQLDLRTRQALLADNVTVILCLSNNGQAIASNVIVALHPSPDYEIVGDCELKRDRVSPRQSDQLEFTIKPLNGVSVHIRCAVTWDDRERKGKSEQFSDVLRFFTTRAEFVPIKNPYITGEPVKAPDMFRGREDVLRFILDNISGPFQDRTILLHGQRRTGKSSILYQLDYRLPDQFIPVYIDMQELAPSVNSMSDLLSEIAYQTRRAMRRHGIDVEEPKAEAFAEKPTRAFSRFVDTLEDTLQQRRVVLMIDEFEIIERKVQRGYLKDDIFDYFRSLMQHRSALVFIFVGAHRLEEMAYDYWSIFFNIAIHQKISYLKEDEARQLITEPMAGSLEYEDNAVDKIIRVTHCHPYFVQLICWSLVNHCNACQRNYATINDVNTVLEDILIAGEAHFAYVWQQSSPKERFVLALLAKMLRPGKDYALLSEIEQALAVEGATLDRQELLQHLDELCIRDVLEKKANGGLRYRFQIELVRLWIDQHKSIEEAIAGVTTT